MKKYTSCGAPLVLARSCSCTGNVILQSKSTSRLTVVDHPALLSQPGLHKIRARFFGSVFIGAQRRSSYFCISFCIGALCPVLYSSNDAKQKRKKSGRKQDIGRRRGISSGECAAVSTCTDFYKMKETRKL